MVEGVGKNDQIVPLDPLGPISQVKGKNLKTSDSIGKSSESPGNKNILADSPELLAAQYILWFSPNNQLSVQLYDGKSDNSIGKIEGVNSELVSLQFENDLHQIAIKVLDAWSKSVKEDIEAMRREANSDRRRVQAERNDRAGHEAYLQTLTAEQRENMKEGNRLTKVANLNEGFAQGLSVFLSSSMVGNPSFTNSTPFVAGVALSIGPQANPLSGGIGTILDQAAPSYSVDLATLGSLYVNMASNIATTRTVLAPVPNIQKIDYEFAKNYAHQILKEISSSEFNNWAMAIVTHGMTQTEVVDEKTVGTLVAKLKIAMLSTALALLYQTEAGGISGQEFVSMIEGDMPIKDNDPKHSIVLQIRSLLGNPMAPEDAKGILAAASSWIDESSKGESLLKVSPLFDAMKANTTVTINLTG